MVPYLRPSDTLCEKGPVLQPETRTRFGRPRMALLTVTGLFGCCELGRRVCVVVAALSTWWSQNHTLLRVILIDVWMLLCASCCSMCALWVFIGERAFRPDSV